MEATEIEFKQTGNVLRSAIFELRSGLYKIRLPAGTIAWQTGIDNYRIDEPAYALVALDAPPSMVNSVPLGIDSRLTLKFLLEGKTVFVQSPANSQSLPISQADPVPKTDKERWLYLELGFPGGFTHNWDSQITVSDSAEPEPEPEPEVDPELLALAQRLAVETKIVQAIYNFGIATSKEQFHLHPSNTRFDELVSEHKAWPALIEVVRLAQSSVK